MDAAPAAGKDTPHPAPLLVSSQDLSARGIHPLKLIALLRAQFGLGQYEISMMRSVYNIRTPRPLSLNEIAQCGY